MKFDDDNEKVAKLCSLATKTAAKRKYTQDWIWVATANSCVLCHFCYMHRFCYFVPFVINLKYFDKTAPASYDFLGVNFYVSTKSSCGFQAGAEMVVTKELQ